MAEKYILRVTAGPSYDLADHTEVPVNTATPVSISTPLADVELNVRIQNYRGLPRNSPTTSPYFEHEPHAANRDTYSIAFRFTPKQPPSNPPPAEKEERKDATAAAPGIPATDLQFGNDFDHPIRDRLPPGFSYAMRIVKWWIDPGLDGDPYADSPYLFGPALSSFNAIHVGPAEFDEARGGLWVEEGAGDEAGRAWRRDVAGAPEGDKARSKWALQERSKEDWVWEYGRTYAVDFFNGYLDFSDLALRLPGYAVPIMKYWDGQGLRYVLRNKTTKDVYLVVLFTLYLREDVNEDGSLKPEAARAYNSAGNDEKEEEEEEGGVFDGEAALEEARKHLSGVGLDAQKVDDDVD